MSVDLSADALRASTAQDRREAYTLLRDAAMPDIGVLRWAAVWLLLAALLEALGPYFGKLLIDNHVVPRQGTVGEIAALVGGAFVASAAASWLRYFQLVRLGGLAMRSVQRIRERVYAHVLRLPMSFFDSAITGQLVSRVTNDTQAVKSLYVQVLFVILDAVITIGGIFALMFWLNWRLSLIALAMIPAVVVVVLFYQRWSCAATSTPKSPKTSTA
jgi:ATP-binding cassette, subfamily B, multidrug efflux pump